MTGLTGDRWRILSSLLDDALELEPLQRPAWLSSLQERDAASAADIRAMLEEHDALSAQGFLEAGIGRLPGTIGPYNLIRELGAGGMGVVWLARQEQPIRRLVAIKVMRPGVDSRLVLSRFEAERQALAILNHPGIAKVLEAGATTDGRPYFVMEPIAGSSITQFADDHRLSIADRLQLFVQVCDAVQHAHHKGVLHRDLKPRNILVSDHDGRHSVTVIDFGVAKALGQRLTADTLQTELGAIVGTPGYMSPEQAGLVDATVDERTDIYSLGLILYEVLAGRPPVDHNEFRGKTVLEALRVIREQALPVLTERLASERDSVAQEIAGKRRTEPRALLRALQGDLEWITGRAIEKEPRERYPSVTALRSDVERHLRGDPILARPPSAVHRLRRLAHGHRALAAGVVIITVAIGLTVASMLGFQRSSPASAVGPGTEPDAASSPLPLTSYQGIEAEAAWSPDGRQLAFTWDGEKENNYDIYVLQPGSSQPVRLTTDTGIDTDPAWSPDGRLIAYAHTAADSSRYSLELLSVRDGSSRPLFTSATPIAAPVWSPDGRALVAEFVREPGRLIELWTISVATSERRQLTFPPTVIVGDIAPAISPDGRTLAFCRKSAWRTSELYLMDLRPDLSPAGEPRRVTTLGYVDRPAWTPDGSRILFETAGESAGIWQLDPITARARPVAGTPPTASQPAVAKRPAGHTSLVFAMKAGAQSIWRYSTRSGPASTPLELAASTRSQNLPRYSNDGKRLAFSSTRSGHQEIWVANADGSGPVQLTTLRHQLTEMGHWSPDDRMIAFESQGRGPRQIYTVASSGGPPVPITNDDGVRFGSGWSRDGTAYYYTSTRSGRREVWRASRRDGTPTQMTTTGGENGFESGLGTFHYFQQRGEGAALLRRSSAGDREVALAPAGSPEWLTVPAAHGFYYKAGATQDIYLYEENNKRSLHVLRLPAQDFGQFTISPDRRWFAATLRRKNSVDLMIMEHFK